MAHCILGGDAVGNRSGLSQQAAFWISEVARSHVMQGAKTLTEVVERTIKDIPGIKEAHVWNALSGRVRSRDKKNRTNTQKKLTQLKSQARLEAQLDDALASAKKY